MRAVVAVLILVGCGPSAVPGWSGVTAELDTGKTTVAQVACAVNYAGNILPGQSKDFAPATIVVRPEANGAFEAVAGDTVTVSENLTGLAHGLRNLAVIREGGDPSTTEGAWCEQFQQAYTDTLQANGCSP